MAVALQQALRIAIGYKKQADLDTALVGGDMLSLATTSSETPQPELVNEDDAEDFGKGIYATQVFPSHINAAFPVAGRLTSEWGAILSCFGLGKTTKTAASTGWKYTCTEFNPDTDGLDMPVTTVAVKIPSGGGAVTDKALIGVACEEWGLSIRQGTGRDNATFTSQWIGTGKYANPSGVTFPAKATEHGLNAGTIASLTLLGVDYITNKRFVSFEFGWKNNLRVESGFAPGSGNQNGYQLRNRMRRGRPTITCRVVVEADTAATEEASAASQATGTMVLNMEGAVIGGATKHALKITLQKVSILRLQNAENDGIATYEMELSTLQHATNGLIAVEATCEQNNVLTAAA